MNCATFRDSHSLLLDGMLDDRSVVAMECHIAECPECAALDTRIRRGLLLFRNASLIAPSADFSERLHARLAAERRASARALSAPPVAMRGPGAGMFAAAAVSVAAVGFLAAATFAQHGARPELALPPVVASRLPEAPGQIVADVSPSPVSSPAIMASVSAGMPLWPSALLLEQAPLHFATSEFQLTSYGQ
jgi:anti-sigma factor RsiW